MDKDLTELRQTLDRLGYVVVPHGDHLCVRLPLAASVRVYSSDGRWRLVSRFGPLGRTAGVLATGALSVAAVAGALALFAPPVALVAGFFGLVGLAHDGYRFVLTESCATRLQQLLIDGSRHPGVGGEMVDGRRLTAAPPRQIGGEHGVDVGAKPGGRVPVPINGPGDE